MNKLISIVIAVLGLSLAAIDVDAASRLSGGRNIGKQRDMTQHQQAAPKAPAQQQQSQAAPAPAKPPSMWSRLMGPLAGLAIGAALASLFFSNGLGGALAGLLMVGAIIAVAVFLVRALRGRTPAERPLGYATAGAAEPTLSPLPGSAGASSVAATTAANTDAVGQWPAGFDAAEFVRHARLNFVRMQEAHDRRDLPAIREFVTGEVYADIEADLQGRGPAAGHKTEVVTLDAEVLDVATEDEQYVVSTRFSGLMREATGEPQAFSEIWHLEKPLRGRGGWLVAGIQQS